MGQAKNKGRHCPSLNRVITSAECGENRASQIDCPSDCPHNPWSPAHYETFSSIPRNMVLGKNLFPIKQPWRACYSANY